MDIAANKLLPAKSSPSMWETTRSLQFPRSVGIGAGPEDPSPNSREEDTCVSSLLRANAAAGFPFERDFNLCI